MDLVFTDGKMFQLLNAKGASVAGVVEWPDGTSGCPKVIHEAKDDEYHVVGGATGYFFSISCTLLLLNLSNSVVKFVLVISIDDFFPFLLLCAFTKRNKINPIISSVMNSKNFDKAAN